MKPSETFSFIYYVLFLFTQNFKSTESALRVPIWESLFMCPLAQMWGTKGRGRAGQPGQGAQAEAARPLRRGCICQRWTLGRVGRGMPGKQAGRKLLLEFSHFHSVPQMCPHQNLCQMLGKQISIKHCLCPPQVAQSLWYVQNLLAIFFTFLFPEGLFNFEICYLLFSG